MTPFLWLVRIEQLANATAAARLLDVEVRFAGRLVESFDPLSGLRHEVGLEARAAWDLGVPSSARSLLCLYGRLVRDENQPATPER